VLREEFDRWAILFDPDANVMYTLNPVGVLVWKYLDGKRSLDEILELVRKECDGVPENAGQLIDDFIAELVKLGLAGREVRP
jgi:SynChlorMet cassette protein ScmD